MIALRPYQIEALDGVRTAFAAARRRVLLVSPTGSGKTLMFCYMAQSAGARGKAVCVLVHRQELVDQTSRALDGLGVDHGIIAAGRTPSRSPVQVASVQTLARRLSSYPEFDLLIVDEAHHAVAGQWRKVAEAYPRAFALGVTATPERLDGRGLGDVFDEMVLGPSVADLVAQGHLTPATVYAPEAEIDLSGIRTKLGDYERGALNAVMSASAITGDAVDHYRRLCSGVPAVAFCCSIEHARQVAAQFRAAGFRATHLDGNTDAGERRHTIAALGAGGLDVLTSCDIVSEGTDIPVLGAAILLRPTQSLGLYLQQVGRALRPAPGKTRAIILDHAGNSRRHGLPDDPREWSLEGRARKKKGGESGPPVRQCPACYAMCAAAARACPACGESFAGAAREIEHREGMLVEVVRDRLHDELRAKTIGEAIRWADTEDKLRLVAKARGYHPGWVRHVMSARRSRRPERTLAKSWRAPVVSTGPDPGRDWALRPEHEVADRRDRVERAIQELYDEMGDPRLGAIASRADVPQAEMHFHIKELVARGHIEFDQFGVRPARQRGRRVAA